MVAATRATQGGAIGRIGRALNDTYLPYAPEPRRNRAMRRALFQDQAARESKRAGSSVQRALFKGKKQYSVGGVADAVTLYEEGKMAAEDCDEENRPAEIRARDKKERAKVIQRKAKKRKRLQKRMEKLDIERRAYLKKQEKATGKTLGSAMISAVRSQVRQKNYKLTR